MKKFCCYIDDKFVRSFVTAHVAMWWCYEMRAEGKNATYKIKDRED